jgi:hypothetical protein
VRRRQQSYVEVDTLANWHLYQLPIMVLAQRDEFVGVGRQAMAAEIRSDRFAVCKGGRDFARTRTA